MNTTVEMRVLRRAVRVLGSESALALALRVPLRDLLAWLEGDHNPARTQLLAAIDVLIQHGDSQGLSQMHSLEPGHVDPITSFRGHPSAEQ